MSSSNENCDFTIDVENGTKNLGRGQFMHISYAGLPVKHTDNISRNSYNENPHSRSAPQNVLIAVFKMIYFVVYVNFIESKWINDFS